MRFVRGFFLHLGTLIPIVTYFVIADGSGRSAEGVRHALGVATVVAAVYLATARAIGEAKQFDVGMLLLFAIGWIGTHVPGAPLLRLYQVYSSALVFVAFGLTALIPLALGATPFTMHYALRQTPAWQQRLPVFDALNRLVATWWVLVFALGAALCAWRPTDVRFTFMLPNLAVFLLGFPAAVWLPPLYLRLRPQPPPEAVEALLLGMPMSFDRRAARDARARIQFHVTGAESGDWWIHVERGRCTSAAGTTPEPDAVVHTPDEVWRGIVHGRIDATQALLEGRYRIEGDVALVAKLGEWFPGPGRQASTST
jgi:SCP-2 sterol transfer family protein